MGDRELNELVIKSLTCYYLNDLINIDDVDLENTELDEKS